MLDFLSALGETQAHAFVSCGQCDGFVGRLPIFTQVSVCPMEESSAHIRFTLREEWTNQHAIRIRIEGVSGRQVLGRLKAMGLLLHYAQAGLWAFEPCKDAKLHPYANCGPVHISSRDWKVAYYHAGGHALRMNSFMPVYVFQAIGREENTIMIAVRDHGAWIVLEVQPVALLMALTRCNFLRPFDYWCGKWRVRLPDDISL